MKFTVEKKERYCIFKLNDENLNSIISPKLKSELVILNAGGFRNIVLDLSEVKYVDSSGLSAILVGNRLCKDANGTFVLTGVNEIVKKLIKISQLDSIINVIPTMSESTDYVMMEELERDLKGEG